MKTKKLFKSLVGSLVLGSLLISFTGCGGSRNCGPCVAEAPYCAPCVAPCGPAPCAPAPCAAPVCAPVCAPKVCAPVCAPKVCAPVCAPAPCAAPCAPVCAPVCAPAPCAAPCAPAPCGPCAPYGPDCKPLAVLDCCDYCLQKVAPNSVAIGCPFDYCYTFTSKIDAVDIVLTDLIPEGAEFISSSPAAQNVGGMLRWEFDKMDKGEVHQLRVTMRATQCGCLRDCMKVTVVPYACTTVCVGQPILQICKSGPCEVCIGECATFNIQVTNTGNFCAEDVVIIDFVPDGMRHSSGKRELRLDVGSLAVGETTTASIQLVAERGGKHCNVARATSCDGKVCEAQACVDVIVPAVKIVKTGPAMQFLEKCAEFTITVTNMGDRPLENLMVYDYIPAGNCLVDAPCASVDCNTASWCIPCLGCGASASFTVVLSAECPGVYTNEACVKGNYRTCDLCECTCLNTEWRGYPALLTEVIDVCDPLLVGEATDYIIKITNQGTAPDTNIRLIAYLPEQMDFVKAEGVTPFNASQKVVTFDPVPCLNPGETVCFKVKARACCVGDAHFEIHLRSDVALRSDLIEQESTQVF